MQRAIFKIQAKRKTDGCRLFQENRKRSREVDGRRWESSAKRTILTKSFHADLTSDTVGGVLVALRCHWCINQGSAHLCQRGCGCVLNANESIRVKTKWCTEAIWRHQRASFSFYHCESLLPYKVKTRSYPYSIFCGKGEGRRILYRFYIFHLHWRRAALSKVLTNPSELNKSSVLFW